MMSPYDKEYNIPFDSMEKAIEWCGSDNAQTIKELRGNRGWFIEEHLINEFNQIIKVYDGEGNFKKEEKQNISNYFLN